MRVKVSRQAVPERDTWPALIVFISSVNIFAPFQLTIRTMLSHAAYPDLHVMVGDNNSRLYRLGGDYLPQRAYCRNCGAVSAEKMLQLPGLIPGTWSSKERSNMRKVLIVAVRFLVA